MESEIQNTPALLAEWVKNGKLFGSPHVSVSIEDGLPKLPLPVCRR
jgi:hypothetical protein